MTDFLLFQLFFSRIFSEHTKMFKHMLSVVPLLFAISLAEFDSHQQPFQADPWSLNSNPAAASESGDSFRDEVNIPSYQWPSALSAKAQQNPEDNFQLYGYYNYLSPELATVS